MLSAVKIFFFPDTNVHPSSQIHQRSSDTSQVAKCLLKHWKTRFLLSSKLSVIEEGWKLAGTCLPRAQQSHGTLTLCWLHWVLSALCSVPATREQPPLPACSCPDFYFYFFPFKFLSIFLKLLWFTTWFAEWLWPRAVLPTLKWRCAVGMKWSGRERNHCWDCARQTIIFLNYLASASNLRLTPCNTSV